MIKNADDYHMVVKFPIIAEDLNWVTEKDIERLIESFVKDSERAMSEKLFEWLKDKEYVQLIENPKEKPFRQTNMELNLDMCIVPYDELKELVRERDEYLSSLENEFGG